MTASSRPGSAWTSCVLNVGRKAHREAVDVDLVHVQPFGLEEDLVPLAVRKPHDLVFERRAVPRADPLNLAVEERRQVDVRANEVVDAIGGVEQMTGDLRSGRSGRSGTRTAPAARRRVPRAKRDKSMLRSRQPRRRAGLQPAPREAEALQRLGQLMRRRLAGAAGRPLLGADVDQAVQERAGRDDQRATAVSSRRLPARDRRLGRRSVRMRPALPMIQAMFGSACERRAAPTRCRPACPPAPAATRPPGRGCD